MKQATELRTTAPNICGHSECSCFLVGTSTVSVAVELNSSVFRVLTRLEVVETDVSRPPFDPETLVLKLLYAA